MLICFAIATFAKRLGRFVRCGYAGRVRGYDWIYGGSCRYGTVVCRTGAGVLGRATSSIGGGDSSKWFTGNAIVGAGRLLRFGAESSSVQLIHAQTKVASTSLCDIVGATNKAV